MEEITTLSLVEKRKRLANLLNDRLRTSSTSTAFDLNAEVFLDLKIQMPHEPSENQSSQTVLLTGATGFLGSHLLVNLLQRTSAKVICLVRANDVLQATDRLRQNLQTYLPDASVDWDRIEVLVGDLSQPSLGLTSTTWDHLAEEVERIYHNGAYVNWGHAYSALRATNVGGTSSIIELACHTRLKQIHYVSSIVAQFSTFTHTPLLTEDISIPAQEVLPLGYPQTKWVAERLLQLAATRGVPVVIYRPGLIGGDSCSGIANTDDFLGRMIKGCIDLGIYPDDLAPHGMGLAPVDYVAAAIIILSLQPATAGNIFHLTNPTPQNNSLVFQYATEYGFKLQAMPFTAWVRHLKSKVIAQPQHAFYPLLPFFEEAETPSDVVPFRLMEQAVDATNTLHYLAEQNISCPTMDSDLIATYFDFFFQSGFLATPIS